MRTISKRAPGTAASARDLICSSVSTTTNVQPVAWIADEIIAEAERVVAEQNAEWGSLRRPG